MLRSDQKLRPFHFFISIVLIVLSIVFISWLKSKNLLSTYEIPGFYKITAIYFVVLTVTAIAISSFKSIDIHRHLGFKKTQALFFVIAIFGALLLFGIDWMIQSYLFQVDIKQEAQTWLNKVGEFNLFLVFISTCLFVPMAEEMLFRGLLLKSLQGFVSNPINCLIGALLFMLLHASIAQSASLLLAAVFYFVLTLKSGSLWPSIIAHIINNSLTFIVYLIYAGASV